MIKKFDDFVNEHISKNPNETPIQKRLREECEELEKQLEEVKGDTTLSKEDRKAKVSMLKDEIQATTKSYYDSI